MDLGIVQNRRATIRVALRNPNRPDLEIEFVLDTGFAGYLTLPQTAIDALGLPYRQSIPTRLADGSRQMMDTFATTIIWQTIEVEVEVLAAGATPLYRNRAFGRQYRLHYLFGRGHGQCRLGAVVGLRRWLDAHFLSAV